MANSNVLAMARPRRGKAPVSPNPSQPTQLTPPLKWAGGKRWLLPILQQCWDPNAHYRLVEPFCGGASVALGLQPNRALLNDVNPHLINFYQQIQQGLRIKTPMLNERDAYFDTREKFNALILKGKADTAKAAGYFYYLNRTGFNGLCRFNKKGLYNVPFGRYNTINYREDFSLYQPTLENWKFRHGDFEDLTIKANDWIYADPPYDVEFTQYSAGGFNWDDQIRLATWLAAQDTPVMVSNQATPRILELYADLGFDVLTLPAPRRIACNGNRDNATEMLAMKNVLVGVQPKTLHPQAKIIVAGKRA